jgi:predicted ArsR family transcriptional regulator
MSTDEMKAYWRKKQQEHRTKKQSKLTTPILEALKKHGEASAWDLAKFLCESPQIVAHTLKHLEADGKLTSRVVAPQRIVFIDSTGQQAYSKTRTKRIYQLKRLEIKDNKV